MSSVPSLPRLFVSANHRFLITADGRPFFWLGDTAWNLFHRTRRDEAESYFADRQQKGFNVIQAVALAEQNGLNSPSANGQRPLHDNDPARPNEVYFAYVDDLIDLAAAHNLYIALLPTWGDKVTPNWGDGPLIFTPQSAYAYGKWIGARYAARSNLIWCLGGDRPLYRGDADCSLVWRALAAGIREATGRQGLLTYHPDGGMTAAACVHAEAWSDVVMIQSGHWARENPAWEWIESLYNLQPPKPVLDGEPNYEDHPVAPWPTWNPANGYFRDYEVRKQTYRSVFAGGCGVTYGHHAIWQFFGPRYEVINYADRPWYDALQRPGAAQMAHLKNLLLSRPYFSRIPDQSLILSENDPGAEHLCATRAHDGQYAFVYFPNPLQTAWIDLEKLSGPAIHAWWYDPRSAAVQRVGDFTLHPEAFTSPADGPDWVLVLDNARAGFNPPGVVG